MRQAIYISFLSVVMCINVSLATGTLTGYLTCATFNTSSGSSYLETYLTIIGPTARFVRDSDNMYQAKVNIDVSFWKGDSEVTEAKYYLHSPETADTLKKPDFIDVQRYWLKRGVYTMKLSMKDEGVPGDKPLTVKHKVNVGYDMDSVRVSDAEFLQSFQPSVKPGVLDKCGYEMVPYVYEPSVYNYYPKEISEIKFYAEIYNAYKIAGEHAKFVMKYFIESAETHIPLPDYSSVSVRQADTVNPLLGGFNIADLPSGSYSLVMQAIDRNNKVIASRSFNFIRQNAHAEMGMDNLTSIDINNTFVSKINNKDTLVGYIQCLLPVSNLNEKDFVESKNLQQSDITILKHFFYNFWASRDPSDPQDAWMKYLQQVKAVDKSFGTYGMRGFQTDRGRVYLQYGAPDQRVRSDMNPTSYPYEIWEYYHLNDGEVDRKFVFYDPDIVTNNYVLLNSDARGEVQNRQWQVILNSRSGQPGNVDQNTIPDPFGENTQDEYSNPR